MKNFKKIISSGLITVLTIGTLSLAGCKKDELFEKSKLDFKACNNECYKWYSIELTHCHEMNLGSWCDENADAHYKSCYVDCKDNQIASYCNDKYKEDLNKFKSCMKETEKGFKYNFLKAKKTW